MKDKVRNAVIIAAGVLILTVMLTVVLYYYNDKVKRDNAWIYSVDEISSQESDNQGKIDINKADVNTIMNIDGIGRRIAHDIVNYREENGKFASMSQLKSVPTVNNEVYEVLCANFTVSGGADNYSKNVSYGAAKVNLNKATVDELLSVEGVTQQIAEDIILRRKNHGDYTTVRELLDINSISITLYNQISDKFTI